MTTPNDRLRSLVAESGLTYEAIARDVQAVAGEHQGAFPRESGHPFVSLCGECDGS